MGADDSLHDGGHGDTEIVKPSDFLLKEMEETNDWARLGAQLYFGWFTLMLTVNGIATDGLLSHRVSVNLGRWVSGIFIGLNSLGTVVTVLIRNQLFASDKRITAVIQILANRHPTDYSYAKTQSPVPRKAINVALVFTALGLLMFLVFWIALEVWPNLLAASPPG